MTMKRVQINNNKIPTEFRDAMLLTVAPDKRCVGIKLFSQSNENVMPTLDNYIDRSVKRAIELKSSIENGLCDVEQNKQIVLNPFALMPFKNNPSQFNVAEKNRLIENENRLIDLGRILIRSMQIGKSDLLKCQIILSEMFQLSKKRITPLMLKKNPEIVYNVLKLCNYADVNKPSDKTDRSKSCLRTRKNATTTLNGFKTVMGFNGTNRQFLNWFNESVKLFHELTSKMSKNERRQVIFDPENVLANTY
ncbi:uncharacterized protein LOC116342320 [Contarinia nasturtii]|uniref:uncharacterized protein LOC116342320 n=1 Tax=Contarinia nasturtii TaxID=265458 RepID=UPI0012D3BB37|nr:uncharacterized protein LOC116342320 [Contarinia nasturtii]